MKLQVIKMDQYKQSGTQNKSAKSLSEKNLAYWPIFKEGTTQTAYQKFWGNGQFYQSKKIISVEMNRVGNKKQFQQIYKFTLLENGCFYYENYGQKSTQIKGHITLGLNLFVKILDLQSDKTSFKAIRLRKFKNSQIYLWNEDEKITYLLGYHFKNFCISQNFDLCYELGPMIGKGGFARVFCVTPKTPFDSSQQEFAAKIYTKDFLSQKSDMKKCYKEMIKSECEILKKISSEYVIKLKEVIQLDDALILICEYLCNGSLYDYIKEYGKLSEKTALEIIYQISLSLEAVHNEGYVHRDLKLENIMIKCKDPIQIKLIDFGFAEKIDEKKLRSGQGTAGYIAPEVFKLQPYSRKSDLFSIGVILFALLSNTSPFKSDNYEGLLELNKQCKISFHKKVWTVISKETMSILKSLLEVNPMMRINLNDLISKLRKILKKKEIDCELKPSNQFDICLEQIDLDGCVESKGAESDPNQDGDLQFHTKTFLSFYKHSNNSQFSMAESQKKKVQSGELSTPKPRDGKQKLTSRTTKSQDVPTYNNLKQFAEEQLDSSDNEQAINCNYINRLRNSILIFNKKKWIK